METRPKHSFNYISLRGYHAVEAIPITKEAEFFSHAAVLSPSRCSPTSALE